MPWLGLKPFQLGSAQLVKFQLELITTNHAFAAPTSLPASVKTVTPTFDRTPEVKPSTNFETAAKKPSVLESNIGNTRIKDNGSNLAPTTVSQPFFFRIL